MIWVLLVGMALATSNHRIEPPDRQLGVVMGTQWVPRDSTIRVVPSSCPAGELGVEVTSVDAWYRRKDVKLVEAGATGCLSGDVLTPADERVRPAERRLRQFFEARFGSISASAIKSTPWDRVALPMVHELSRSEIQEAYSREGLVTTKQRERTVIAEGPRKDGKPIYAHFLGSDAPRSDRWATIRTIERLLELADAWAEFCRTQLSESVPEANADTCLLQIGDLAYYHDILPDPLGHRTHHSGECVDLRLFRFPASRYEAYWNRRDDRTGKRGGYSRVLTKAFIAFALEHSTPKIIHFNDPSVVQSFAAVTPALGHDDHIHMCF